jgi:hypothetical protein
MYQGYIGLKDKFLWLRSIIICLAIEHWKMQWLGNIIYQTIQLLDGQGVNEEI